MLFFLFAMLCAAIYLTRSPEEIRIKQLTLIMTILFLYGESYFMYEGWKISQYYNLGGTATGMTFNNWEGNTPTSVKYMTIDDIEIRRWVEYQRVSQGIFEFIFTYIIWLGFLAIGMAWGYFKIKNVFESAGYHL